MYHEVTRWDEHKCDRFGVSSNFATISLMVYTYSQKIAHDHSFADGSQLSTQPLDKIHQN